MDTIEFKSDDELRKPLSGTYKVQLRPQKDKDTGDMLPLGELRQGTSKNNVPWILLPFEVVGGENDGEWASTMLWVRPDDKKFRKVFEAITGIDVSSGGNVSFDQFITALKEGVFEAELGPDMRNGEETGYTEVKRINGRVGDREESSSVSTDTEAPADGASDGDEDDIPF